MANKEIVLIFDGDCGFCTTSANFAVKHSKTPIKAVPWQYTDFSELPMTQVDAQDQVYLMVDGKAFGGHEGFAMMLRIQRNPLLRFAGAMAMNPPISWIARPIYRVVAKYRHRLPGGTPACKLPSK